MNKVIRLGLIGCGARLRAVVKELLRAAPEGRLEITALCDPDPLSLTEARETLDTQARTYATADELVAADDVDWVFIGSPNCHHPAHVIAAARHGKAIFCEKPLATNIDDCLLMAAEVRKGGRPFAFGLVLRYAPLYQEIHRLLNEGVIGRLVSFEFNETLNYNHGGYIMGNWRRLRQLAGTHLLEKCCHDLDLANWLTGSLPVQAASFGGRDVFRPENAGLIDTVGPDDKGRPAYQGWEDRHRVNPFLGDRDIVDNQVAILQYANGARATFHTNCHAALTERRFYLLGDRGSIRADLVTGVVEWKRVGPHEEPERRTPQAEEGHGGGDHVLAHALVDILLHGATPRAGIDESLRSAIAAFGIDSAMDTGRVVDLRPLWQQAGIEPR